MADNKKEEPKKPTHKVIKEFRDINNYDLLHEVGDDVSHFEADRLARLVENGHVEDLTKVVPAEPGK